MTIENSLKRQGIDILKKEQNSLDGAFERQAKEKAGMHLAGESASDSIEYKVIDILYELPAKIPDSIDLEITRLVLNPGRLVLSGTTGNYNQVDKIKGLIESSKLFNQVRISSATADKTGNTIVFKFIIDL